MAAEFPSRTTPAATAQFAKQGLTFDDAMLLVPGESAVLPTEVSTATA